MRDNTVLTLQKLLDRTQTLGHTLVVTETAEEVRNDDVEPFWRRPLATVRVKNINGVF